MTDAENIYVHVLLEIYIIVLPLFSAFPNETVISLLNYCTMKFNFQAINSIKNQAHHFTPNNPRSKYDRIILEKE